jgi:hypothetical protein
VDILWAMADEAVGTPAEAMDTARHVGEAQIGIHFPEPVRGRLAEVVEAGRGAFVGDGDADQQGAQCHGQHDGEHAEEHRAPELLGRRKALSGGRDGQRQGDRQRRRQGEPAPVPGQASRSLRHRGVSRGRRRGRP